ncbi:BTB/POZ domain-containing protein [Thecamonas trahens ATCC 50062]|uniref:BTB/POZ domain-containing protein n=1 Tax=Thecamonas trahens ATCC 50062 TaxID=461836 RepID=A0A0L0DDU5_THETB|nr:BTB/POZ domain-containing protein [Thecamonas trahens ATCC 50062]KNC50474.1 BTB/POZ domain-containing protein [Thecamonas trahens ATCC 50062]|eukprot:XP_013762370.1 BTB/POZ domain-containing protein [Thecamonas trahens ATCC 50062]
MAVANVTVAVAEVEADDAAASLPQTLANSWLRLNVGGQIITTSRTTLTMDGESVLARMFAPDTEERFEHARDESGAILIDRDPRYFLPLLNYLRTSTVIIDPGTAREGVYEEAVFFGVTSLATALHPSARADLTRKDIILRSAPSYKGVSIRGLDLSGLDLTDVDFSGVDARSACFDDAHLAPTFFRNAELGGCSFRTAKLEQASLAEAVANEVDFTGATIKRAYFLSASLQHALFDEADVSGCNFQKAILRGASFSGASLVECRLQRCDLRDIDFTTTTLTGSSFSCADIRGASFDWVTVAQTANVESSFHSLFDRARVTSDQLAAMPLSDEDKAGLNFLVVADNEQYRPVIPTDGQ